MGKNKNVNSSGSKLKDFQYGSWIALGFILILVTIIKIRLLGIPLERDEGEYAYMGQFILH